jgi:hypothetical protein
MLHFVSHCHKLDLENLIKNSKQVDALRLHKSFFFSHPSFARGGVKHCHHGKRDKRCNATLHPVEYEFLLGS